MIPTKTSLPETNINCTCKNGVLEPESCVSLGDSFAKWPNEGSPHIVGCRLILLQRVTFPRSQKWSQTQHCQLPLNKNKGNLLWKTSWPKEREWGKFHPQYTNEKVEGPSFPTGRASQKKMDSWKNVFLRTLQHTPGTYPRPPTNSLWRNSFHLGVWGSLGYAPGVCWGSLRVLDSSYSRFPSNFHSPPNHLCPQGKRRDSPRAGPKRPVATDVHSGPKKHHSGWLIGILTLAYYNPYITG